MPEVYTYNNVNQNRCNLQDVNTVECVQVFDIYAKSYTGVIDLVATYTLTIKSECFDI